MVLGLRGMIFVDHLFVLNAVQLVLNSRPGPKIMQLARDVFF